MIVLLGLGVVTGYLALAGFLLVAGVVAALWLPDPPAPAASASARSVRRLSQRLDDSARDLGFVTVAASLGQLLGPVIGAGLVALVGGFWLLFAVGGVLSIVGGLMTLEIRRRPADAAVSSAPR